MTPATDIVTRPGETIVVGQQNPQLTGDTAPSIETNRTSMAPFSKMKHLLSDRPLRRPNRTRPIEDIENEIDLAALDEREDEPTRPWEDVRRELGM